VLRPGGTLYASIRVPYSKAEGPESDCGNLLVSNPRREVSDCKQNETCRRDGGTPNAVLEALIDKAKWAGYSGVHVLPGPPLWSNMGFVEVDESQFGTGECATVAGIKDR
jgi:hypothetical protein